MNILFLTHRLPYAPNRGDRIRAHHMLRAIGRRHEVHLVSLVHDDDEQREVGALASVAASVQIARVRPLQRFSRALGALATGAPLTHGLLDAPEMHRMLTWQVQNKPPDIVLAYCSGMARFALEAPLAEIPLIFDMVDVDSEKWTMLAERSSHPLRWLYQREARRLRQFEASAANRAVTTTVINDRERSSLLRIAPSANVQVLSNGIDVSHFQPCERAVTSARVVFTGVFNYAPNEQGAIWMAEQVWPLVRVRRPDARLVLVGANPTRAVRRLAEKDGSIEVTGTVVDVRPHLWEAAVAVVPLSAARGLQNKALEAIAAGLPVVVTRIVRDGLPLNVEPACVVADDPRAFAEAVLAGLARLPAERRQLARRADLSSLDWPTQLKPLLQIIEATVRQPSARTA